jgi:uncharacterized protein
MMLHVGAKMVWYVSQTTPGIATAAWSRYAAGMKEPQSIHPREAWADLKRWREPLFVLVLAAVLLTLVEYLFLSRSFVQFFPELTQRYAPGVWYGSWDAAPRGTQAPWWGPMTPWLWWAGGTFLLWVIVPCCFALLARKRIIDFGLSIRGALPKWWVYLLLFGIVMIGVFWAAHQPGFTSTYPFVKPRYAEQFTWGLLLAWWVVYGAQFFAVEFFFRGWMLFSLEKHFGLGAIAVMIVPYCMIHYHKPLPEALGAIIAGIVLGWLALKTRSIWGGVVIHVAVAISMDALSLWKQGALP